MTAEKTQREAKEAFRKLEKKCTRQLIVEESPFVQMVVPSTKFVTLKWIPGVFPRTHGSAFFQRGETQSLVTCTLGTGRDEQIVDGLCQNMRRSSTFITTSHRSVLAKLVESWVPAT